MGKPKTPERRKPANAELRSAMSALELWIRHAAVKNSGVVKVTHHELVTIHDTLILALREDNPQSLLVLDTNGGTEVSKDIVEGTTNHTPVDKDGGEKAEAEDSTDVPAGAGADAAAEIEETILAELEPQLNPDAATDPDASDDPDSETKA